MHPYADILRAIAEGKSAYVNINQSGNWLKLDNTMPSVNSVLLLGIQSDSVQFKAGTDTKELSLRVDAPTPVSNIEDGNYVVEVRIRAIDSRIDYLHLQKLFDEGTVFNSLDDAVQFSKNVREMAERAKEMPDDC